MCNLQDRCQHSEADCVICRHQFACNLSHMKSRLHHVADSTCITCKTYIYISRATDKTEQLLVCKRGVMLTKLCTDNTCRPRVMLSAGDASGARHCCMLHMKQWLGFTCQNIQAFSITVANATPQGLQHYVLARCEYTVQVKFIHDAHWTL